jgi:hypothetical protein
MAFHYLWETYQPKLPNLEQIREYISLYGINKENSNRREYWKPFSGIHCGTNYRVLRNWMTISEPFCRGFCDCHEKPENPVITWKCAPETGAYKYEFAFHQAKIEKIGEDWEKMKKRVVGSSFHPEGFFKKK